MKPLLIKHIPRNSRRVEYIILFCTIFIAVFLRLYNLPDRLYLGNETSREALIGLIGANEFQLPLTSQFSSSGPFTHGVWFWWVYILGSMVFQSPYGPWMTQVTFSVLFVLMIYLIGKKLGSPALGLIGAYIAAVSPTQLISALHLTNPNLLLFFAAASLYMFIVLISEPGTTKRGLTFGILLGILMNIHYSGWNFLILLPLVALWGVNRRTIIAPVLVGLTLMNIPYLMFNLLNHWYIAKNFLYYLQHGKEMVYVANSWRIYLGTFWPGLFAEAIGIPVAMALIYFMIGGAALVLTVRKKIHVQTLAVFLILFIAMRYFWGERYNGYFNFFSPFVFLFAALPFALLFQMKSIVLKIVCILGLIGYTAYIWPQSVGQLRSQPETVGYRELSQKIHAAFPGKNIALFTCGYDYSPRDYSLLYYLYTNHASGNDVKLILSDEKCEIPLQEDDSTGLNIIITGTTGDTASIGLIDVSAISDDAMATAGWGKLTAKDFYDQHVKWWYRERP